MGGWQVPTQPVEPRARKSRVAAQFCAYVAAQGVRYNASMSTETSTSTGGSPAAGEGSQTTTAAAGEGAKESGAPKAGEGAGAGSKDAVLADLKAEREKRQALQAELEASQELRTKLAELLGGKLSHESTRGLGSRFELTLNVAIAQVQMPPGRAVSGVTRF